MIGKFTSQCDYGELDIDCECCGEEGVSVIECYGGGVIY